MRTAVRFGVSMPGIVRLDPSLFAPIPSPVAFLPSTTMSPALTTRLDFVSSAQIFVVAKITVARILRDMLCVISSVRSAKEKRGALLGFAPWSACWVGKIRRFF